MRNLTKNLSRRFQLCWRFAMLAGVACFGLATSALANDIIKANNANALNTSGSWVVNGPPGSGDTAVVNNTLTATTSAALGGSMTWQGIRVADPAGALLITATAGTSLTLGTNGIDMTAALQGLTINSIVNLGGANTWNIGVGQLLTIGGAITNNGNTLTITGDGNTTISTTNWGAGGLVKTGSGTLAWNRANQFTGNATIIGGTLNATGGTGFGGVLGVAGTVTVSNATLNAITGNNAPFGNPGVLRSGNVILQPGGLLTIAGANTTAHIPRLLVMSGGELGSTVSSVSASFGTWNLEQGVLVNGGVNTSTMSALGMALNQAGGTVFDVGSDAANGVDLDVTGYFGHYVGTGVADNGLIKKGAGVMRLTGVNTYTSATTISNGVLALSGSGSIGSSSQIFVAAGATFDVSGATFALSSGQALTGSGVVTGAVFVAGGGRISPGPGAATLSFSNSLTLSGSTTNIFDLSTNPNGAGNDRIAVAGDLILTSDNYIQVNYTTLGAGRYKLFTYGGTLTGGTNNLILMNVVGNGRQLVYLDDTVPNEIALVVAGANANLRWVGDGVANNWDANVTQDWFNTGTSTADFFFNGDNVTFNDSGSKTPDVNLVGTLQPTSILVTNSTGTYTINGSGILSGPASLTKLGAGTLVIANFGFNDFTGKTTVGGGVLNINGDSALGAAPGAVVADQLTLNGATLQAATSFALAANRGITLGTNGGTVDMVSGAMTFAGPISGSGSLTKTGDGTFTVTAANNPYTGKTIINGGILSMNGITRLGAVPTNVVLDQITIDNGAQLLYTAAAVSTSPVQRGFRIGAGGGNMSCNTSGTLAIEGPLTGSGNLTNSGNNASVGTIELDNPTNSFSGDIYNLSGFFRVDDDGQFGTGKLYWMGGGLTANNDRGTTANYINNAIEMSGDFLLRANNSTTDTSVRNIVFRTDSLVATGGALTLSNLRAVSNHVFNVWFAGAGYNFTPAVVVNCYSTNFTYLGFANTNGTTQTFSGLIFGAGGLRRSALTGLGGTTILTGDSTYSGGTIVDNGTLLVNNVSGSGTGSGAVVVSDTGRLGGTGAVAGAVSGNGTVAPGASVGTLTLNGGLDLSSGGTYAWELGANSTNNPGTDFDQLVLGGGNLVLGGTSKLQIQFTGTATTPSPSTPFWQVVHTWRIVSLAGGSNPGPTTFGSVVNATTAAGTFSTQADANGILLVFTPGALPPAPVLSANILGAGTTNATLSWSAQNGVNYQVQYKDDLNTNSWSVLGNVTASGATASFNDTTGPVPKRFYRIVTQ